MHYIGMIYSMITKLRIIVPLIILAILVQRIVNKDEGILDATIWFAYSVGIAILYFITLKSFENFNVTGFLHEINILFFKGVNLIYCIIYTLLILLKEEKKKGIIGPVSLTITPILFNLIEWFGTR